MNVGKKLILNEEKKKILIEKNKDIDRLDICDIKFDGLNY